jgi:hypothetical protein
LRGAHNKAGKVCRFFMLPKCAGLAKDIFIQIYLMFKTFSKDKHLLALLSNGYNFEVSGAIVFMYWLVSISS